MSGSDFLKLRLEELRMQPRRERQRKNSLRRSLFQNEIGKQTLLEMNVIVGEQPGVDRMKELCLKWAKFEFSKEDDYENISHCGRFVCCCSFVQRSLNS